MNCGKQDKKKGLLERITSSRVFRVMFSRKIIVVCAILLLIMVLIAIFAPVIAPMIPTRMIFTMF